MPSTLPYLGSQLVDRISSPWTALLPLLPTSQGPASSMAGRAFASLTLICSHSGGLQGCNRASTDGWARWWPVQSPQASEGRLTAHQHLAWAWGHCHGRVVHSAGWLNSWSRDPQPAGSGEGEQLLSPSPPTCSPPRPASLVTQA